MFLTEVYSEEKVRINYFSFVTYNIRLIELHGERAVAINHTAKPTYLMSEGIV